MGEQATVIDDYIANYPQEVQSILQRFRTLAHEVEPSLVEAISYGVPTFRLGGKNAFHFGAYPHHISVYPVPANPELRKHLEPYIKGKGTLQFALGTEVPYELIQQVFAAHVMSTRDRLA